MTLAVGLGLLGAIVYAFLPQPVMVDLSQVTLGPLSISVDEDGKTRIRDRYIVSAPLSGKLLRVELRPGDPVAAGQTIVSTIEPVDPALLDPRALTQAELSVKSAEVSLQQAAPNLERARAALEFAQSEHDRAQKLYLQKTSTRQDLENAALLERTRAAEFKSAKLGEEIAGFELELARAALLRTRPQSGSTADEEWHFEIRSPISGRVLRVFQESAAVVAAGTTLLELGDPRNLEVEIDVLSSDAVKISPGDKVLLEQWGGDETLMGSVRLIEPAAFTKVSALGVEEQRVNVLVDFVDPPEKRHALGDGFRVEARTVIWENSNVLKVPTSALFRHREEWAVFLLVNNQAILQPVKIGRRNGLEAELIEGVQQGNTVIAHPSDKVRHGVVVVPRKE